MYPRFFFAAMSGTLGYFLYGFMEPVLAFRVSAFQLSQVQIGLFFIVMPVFYIPTSVLVQRVPNGIEKRAVLIIASFLSFFTNLCVGPSKLFELPDSIWIMMLGQALRGIVDPFILVPSLPEMIESVLPLYPDNAEQQINDLSSGMFNMFLGIGQIAGPLFGAAMTQANGFGYTCDSVSLICLLFSILYYLLGDGSQAMRNSQWSEHKVGEFEVEDVDGGIAVNPHNISKISKVSYRSGIYSPCSNPISLKHILKKGDVNLEMRKWRSSQVHQADTESAIGGVKLQSEKSALSRDRQALEANKRVNPEDLKQQLSNLSNEKK